MFSDKGLAPPLEAVEYSTFKFENKFEQPSIYRGPLAPELLKAWEDLVGCRYLPLNSPSTIKMLISNFYNIVGAINIPDDKSPLLNKSLETAWPHTPEEFGGGSARPVKVFHRLHCLVRQDIPFRATRNYYHKHLPLTCNLPRRILSDNIHIASSITTQFSGWTRRKKRIASMWTTTSRQFAKISCVRLT
jgi:hypothetical protein